MSRSVAREDRKTEWAQKRGRERKRITYLVVVAAVRFTRARAKLSSNLRQRQSAHCSAVAKLLPAIDRREIEPTFTR